MFLKDFKDRFKGLDLIDRVPDELWNEVRDIVQKTGIKTIPMEKKCQKAKWLSGEALQIAVKRREAKSKGEKERYKHLNAEFQRIARRDKKDFFSNQCKEIEENNRMGETRDLLQRRQWHPTPVLLPGKSHGWRSLVGSVHGVAKSWTQLSNFPFTFHFHASEKEMATHSSVFAWRIPGTGEPGGLLSMGSHRVGHD